jgi:hypothetical protein
MRLLLVQYCLFADLPAIIGVIRKRQKRRNENDNKYHPDVSFKNHSHHLVLFHVTHYRDYVYG